MRTTNFRLGYKTAGDLYLRIEMGYGNGDVPLTLIYKAVDISALNYFELKTKKIPEINGISKSDVLVGNIGLGISF